ncbi:unnamed protein product [Rangifer tarandus platyrhynchus]|uniref:Uncharacterized protein n=2 Tax=Rangifer tarandus platyrhynchus TaxID=3082113 RepID=A0ABN8YQ64_RANTA|nr:unnamed protein product [Rangifer tarandus platyrhynchus]
MKTRGRIGPVPDFVGLQGSSRRSPQTCCPSSVGGDGSDACTSFMSQTFLVKAEISCRLPRTKMQQLLLTTVHVPSSLGHIKADAVMENSVLGFSSLVSH